MKNKILISMLIINVMWAGGNKNHSHDNDKHWQAPKTAQKVKNPIKSDKPSIAKGLDIYNKSCVICHGKGGNGTGEIANLINPKPTNLKEMAGVHSDGDIAWKIAEGKGVMPSWKNKLSKNDIWDLVNYIQSLQERKKHQHRHHH